FNAGFEDFALDLPHNTAYFVSSSSFFGTGYVTTTRNFLYKATGVTSSATAGSVTMTQLPVSPNDPTNGGNFFPGSDGIVWSIDVDPTSEIVYFTTLQLNNNTNGGVFSYAINNNNTGIFNTVWAQPSPLTATSGSGHPDGGLERIAINPATNTYYVNDWSAFAGLTPAQDNT